MKIFDNNYLDKNKPIHINSALHPAGGYVAKPKCCREELDESRDEGRLKKFTRGTGYVAIPESNSLSLTGNVHANG